MTDTALANPLRRVVRLLPVTDRQADPEPASDRPLPLPLPLAHDRTRPAHCRIAMQFED
ncbi:hypothetical protein [Kitasatospora sp. NPDC097643]|uniref:hypothetical protein n=1 Tax=Kitasatospora sp. NPDC097643 TaxID=3157230 RepID=UPI00332377D4